MRLAVLLAASLGLPGCTRPAGDRDALVVASPWTADERDSVAAAFRHWPKGRDVFRQPPPRIVWMPIDRGDDVARVMRRGRRPGSLRHPPPDVVLGGPAASYIRAAGEGRLVAVDCPGHPTWCVVRRSPIWRAVSRKARTRAKRKTAGSSGARPPASPRSGLTFDDPRHDPIALAWAESVLESGPWAEGYARLVREAARASPIGRRSGSALAAVERGEAEAAPATVAAPATAVDPTGLADRVEFLAADDAAVLVEGVAIVREGGHRDLARAFLRFLVERGEAEPPPADRAEDLDPEVEALLADLLGATLVDAQDELRAARAALDRAGPGAARGAMWMTQPPPWPPASVARLGTQDPSGGLVQALAEQVAPDPGVRAWLLRSWLGPERPIDGRWLAELGRAADGRLVREPRLRAWLRAEWTAWARQRYRRVARKAEDPAP